MTKMLFYTMIFKMWEPQPIQDHVLDGSKIIII